MPSTRRWGRLRAGRPETHEQLGVSPETLASMCRTLGLAGESSAEEIMTAIDELNVVRAARLQVDVPPPGSGVQASRVLDWAEATGRIAASARPQWEATYAASPQATDALLRVLGTSQRPDTTGADAVAAARAQPPSAAAPAVAAARAQSTVAAAAGAAAGVHQSATGLDVSGLPSRMRAAAARLNDPTLVVQLIQEFGGKTNADADPTWLHMCGYQAVAAEVAKDDAEVYQAAAAAYMNGTGPNPEGLPDLYAE